MHRVCLDIIKVSTCVAYCAWIMILHWHEWNPFQFSSHVGTSCEAFRRRLLHTDKYQPISVWGYITWGNMLTWSYFFPRMIQPYTLSDSAILPFRASALGVVQPRNRTFESKFFFPFTALTTFLYTSARSLFFCTFGSSKYSKSL